MFGFDALCAHLKGLFVQKNGGFMGEPDFVCHKEALDPFL
jgi:hypothetical protein